MSASSTPSRGRSRTRSHTPTAAQRDQPPTRASPHSRSRSRSSDRRRPTRMDSRSPSRGRSPTGTDRNGTRRRTRSRSPLRSRSPARSVESRTYRRRSYLRSPSRERVQNQSSKIVVEKLTKNVTRAHLREIFGGYGEIESLDMPMNRTFMTNRGTAYIVYSDPVACEAAITHMHSGQIDGSTISVSIVLPRNAFSRSPPPAKSSRGPPFPSRAGPPPPRGAPSSSTRYRSPQPPRRGGYGGRGREDDTYLPQGRRGYSRSPSPPRRRNRSVTYSRSPSRTPPRRQREPIGPEARRVGAGGARVIVRTVATVGVDRGV